MIENSNNPPHSNETHRNGRHGTGLLSSTPVRNVAACCAALVTYCIFDYLYVRCGVSTPEGAGWLLIPVLYLTILWANRNIFRSETGGLADWVGRASVSALLFPVYALIIVTLGVWFHLAIGGRL